jgi:HK97 family phage prohead protease
MEVQEMFVRPVEGDDDLFAFRFDFMPEGKAVDDGQSQLVEVQDNGDLIIEGYAAVWEGDDRQGENFAEGSLSRGIKSFLEGQAALCYHHKHDKLLGRFLDLKEDGKGLKFKARVDGAIQRHPELGVYYEQIKNGSLRGMSIGGFFRRMGKKITNCDFTEISVTPVPVHPGTSLAVVAGKALKDMPSVSEGMAGNVRESDEQQVNWLIDELETVLSNIEGAITKRTQSTTEATA